MRNVLRNMFDCLNGGKEVYQPSKFWEQLNEKNIEQLENAGLQNIKRTVAQNYFTWVVGLRNDQFRKLAMSAGVRGWLDIIKTLPRYNPASNLGRIRFFELYIFTRMLWNLAEQHDVHKFLDRVDEPEYGNPFPFFMGERLISQDLANSVLEMSTIFEVIPEPAESKYTICELGAGYGRNAYVFLKAFNACKYIIVDIPPALYVSQEYLANVFPERNIMKFSCFENIDDKQEEFEKADIVFLLPHQAEQLESKSIDLFLNISSLHEMTQDQISEYFKQIDRLTRGYFYMKQWKSFFNARDGVTIDKDSYPYPSSWQPLLDRTALAQPAFFETLFQVTQD